MADTKEKKDLAPVEPNASERFTAAVISRYGSAVGEVNLTDYEKQLVQRYFIKFDAALKTCERDRLAKNAWAKEKNELPATWKNVDLEQLAEDVVFYARMGLDPCMKNFLSIIPFRAKKADKYTATFIEGYEGKKYVAFEMALDRPLTIICDVVYKNDVFRPHRRNPADPASFDSYEFDTPEPFNRGELVGGFGYVQYTDPRKNQLLVMSKKDIDKRKPRYASPEFWGGEKEEWEMGDDGKRKKVTRQIDGWYDEMAYKTVVRATCDLVGLDPKKVNANYAAIEARREEFAALSAEDQVTSDISANANAGPVVDVEAPVVPVDEQPAQDEPEVVFPADEKAAQQQTFFQQGKK
jgi:recombination protein RecT